jgi:hypothetical protein
MLTQPARRGQGRQACRSVTSVPPVPAWAQVSRLAQAPQHPRSRFSKGATLANRTFSRCGWSQLNGNVRGLAWQPGTDRDDDRLWKAGLFSSCRVPLSRRGL